MSLRFAFELAGYRYEARLVETPRVGAAPSWVVSCSRLGQQWILPGEASPGDTVRQVQRRFLRYMVRLGEGDGAVPG